MELGLSLGDAPKSFGFLRENNSPNQQQIPSKKSGLDFRLGLCSKNEERGKAQKSQEKDEGNDGDDEDADDGSDDNQETATPLQLNLLPLAPVPRQISSHLWSSDNGSSENGSSGNMGHPAANGLDVNRTPAAEEVSSANSMGSPLQMEFNTYGKKREFAAAAETRSDDDENGLNARKKLRLSKEQSAFLEESFKEHNTLNPKQKLALAKQLNLRPRQVEVWFQNRRARTKLKQTEVDCEYLKRCCDTLTEENRRLHKELQELRALKSSSNPFHMQHLQLPPTTLTMCPSCERVSTNAEPTPTPTPKPIPFPLTRPTFYPFSNSNQPAGS